MKRMNAYLLTMIWILGAVLVLMLLCYVISGFDLGALVLVSILWCIPTLPFLLFIACTFILGDRVVVCVWAVDLYVADFVPDGCRS